MAFFRNKNPIKHYVCLLAVFPFLFPSGAYAAFSLSAWYANKPFRPVVALGGGVASTSDLGESQTFPIQNVVTDERYHYSPHQATQTSGLIDAFIGAEWCLYPKWLAEVGVGYNQAAPFSAKGSFSQGADPGSTDVYAYHYGVLVRQLLVEGKLLYTVKERFHPYVFGGLGASFNKAYNYYTTVPPFLAFTRSYQDNSVTSFSYALGVGIEGDMTKQLRLGVGYRWTDLGQVKLGQAHINTLAVSGSLSQSHLYTNEWLAQLTYLFT